MGWSYVYLLWWRWMLAGIWLEWRLAAGALVVDAAVRCVVFSIRQNW